MTTKFNVKDTVVAFDWGKPYEAVVIKTKENEDQTMVFIHFKGWSRKYDAWYDAKNIALKSDEEKIKVLQAEVANTARISSCQERGQKNGTGCEESS